MGTMRRDFTWEGYDLHSQSQLHLNTCTGIIFPLEKLLLSWQKLPVYRLSFNFLQRKHALCIRKVFHLVTWKVSHVRSSGKMNTCMLNSSIIGSFLVWGRFREQQQLYSPEHRSPAAAFPVPSPDQKDPRLGKMQGHFPTAALPSSEEGQLSLLSPYGEDSGSKEASTDQNKCMLPLLGRFLPLLISQEFGTFAVVEINACPWPTSPLSPSNKKLLLSVPLM